MTLFLTLLLTYVVIHFNCKPQADNFIQELAVATKTRYVTEYAKLRPVEESAAVLSEMIHSVVPSTRSMNPYNYTEFKTSICDVIHRSDKSIRAELCFIHDLMLEEYHKLNPDVVRDSVVGVNEFYNLFRVHL